MTRGFTLIEVVVAVVVLEIAIVGALGLIHLSSLTLRRAEAEESLVAHAEGVLDSLLGVDALQPGVDRLEYGEVGWAVDSTERIVRLVARTAPNWDTLLVIEGPR